MTLPTPVLALTIALLPVVVTANAEFDGLVVLSSLPRNPIVLPETDVSLDWPIAGTPVLNSPFGPRQLGSQSARYDWHRGLDLKMPMGTDILAPADAYVVHAGTHPGYSDTIIQLRHNTVEPFVYTLYLHMGEVLVTAGDMVAKGDLIGKSGQGSATYPHLHWEVRRGCLLQVCCESPYGYLDYTGTPPDPPVLRAAGDSPTLGRMLLLFWSMPKDEIDFHRVEVEWGAITHVGDLDELNALTPTGQAAKLDDPLFFFETAGYPFAFLPKRFNDTFASADYEFLVWDLDTNTDSGDATVIDGSGIGASSVIAPDFPPLSVIVSDEQVTLEPGAAFSFTHQVTNNDAVPRDLTFEGISAQSLTLSVTPEDANVGAGATVPVTVSGTLSASFPEGVGDIVLLKTTVTDQSWTPYLSGTLIDTSNGARVEDWGSMAD